jgi:hypothetical protein
MGRVANSWRETRSARQKRSRTSARVMRWLVSLAILGAIGFYIWLVFRAPFPERIPETRLLSIVVSLDPATGLPALDFPEAEAALLPADITRSKPDTHAESLRHLEDDLDGLGTTGEDVLVVYIRTQGFTLEEEAFLAGNDFSPRRSLDEGRLHVRELLKAVNDATAATRILLIDYGQLCSEPLVGMTENQFPKAIDRIVQELEEGPLFVVLSHGTLQVSQTDVQRRAPVFLSAIQYALDASSQADRNGNGSLSVGEFYHALTSYCDLRIQEEDCRQTPLLFQAGRGLIASPELRDDPRLFTLDVPEPSEPEEGSDQQPSEEELDDDVARTPAGGEADAVNPARTTASRSPGWNGTVSPVALQDGDDDGSIAESNADDSGEEDEEQEPSENQEEPETSSETDDDTAKPEPEPAVKPPPEDADADTLMWYQLERTWTALAALKSRRDGVGFSPVDFAPHLLHAVEAELIELERGIWAIRELRSGVQASITSRLQSQADELERLKQAIDQQQSLQLSGFRSDPLSRLMREWEEFLSRGTLAGLNAEFAKVDRSVHRHWAFAHDAQFRLAQLLRWHGLASRSRTLNLNTKTIEDLIERTLQFDTALQQLEQKPADSSDLARLQNLSGEIREFQRQLDEQFRLDVDEILAHFGRRSASWTIRFSRTALDLLATSLPAPSDRIALVKQIHSGRAAAIEIGPVQIAELTSADVRGAFNGDAWRRRNALSQQALRQPLLESLELETARSLAEMSRGQEELHPRRRVSLALLLPDAGLVTYEGHLFARVSFPERPDPERLTIAAAGGSQQPVGMEWTPIPFRIIRHGPGTGEIHLHLEDFDPQELELRRPLDEESGVPFDPLDPQPIAIEGNGERLVVVEARARSQTSRNLFTDVRLSARTETLSDAARIRLRLPKPNRIRFLAEAVQLHPELRDPQRVRLYPNRETSLQFFLENESAWDREFRVDLVHAPIPVTRTESVSEMAALRHEVLDPTGEIRSAVDVLATVPRVQVPALDKVRLPFLDPQRIPPETDDEEEAAKPAPPPDEDQKPVPLPNGLVYVIREVASAGQEAGSGTPSGERPEPLVEIRPLQTAHIPPRDFLDAEVWYDRSTERVLARVSARDLEGDGQPDPNLALPRGWRDPPIEVSLSNDQDFPEIGVRSQYFDDVQAVATVFARVPPDGSRYRLELDVDGYPRAFVFTGTSSPNAARTPADLRTGDLREILVASISVPDAPYRFLPIGRQVRGVAADPESKLPPVLFDAAVFPGPVKAPFLVRLRVDAPNDAFINPESSDSVLVKFGDLREKVFQSDRLERLTLIEVTETGIVTLRCDVTDLEHQFDIGQFENVKLTLQASLQVHQQPYYAESIPIVVDSKPPVEKRSWLEPALARYPVNRPLTCLIETEEDDSGIDSVQVEIQHAVTNAALTAQPLNAAPVAGSDGLWRVRFDPQLVEFQPGQTYRVRTTIRDRVGLETTVRGLTFSTTEPATDMKKPEKETPGVVKGRIVKRGRPLERAQITVELVGSGKPPQRVDPGGNFEFTDVPEGTYKLEATGSFRGLFHGGSVESVQPSPADKPRVVDLPLTEGR